MTDERRIHRTNDNENTFDAKHIGWASNNNTKRTSPAYADSESFIRARLKAQDKSSILNDSTSLRSVGESTGKEKTNNAPRRQMLDASKRFSGAVRHKQHMFSPRASRLTPRSGVSHNGSFDDSVFYSPHYDEVLQTARGLCRDYICYRLKRSGFQGRVVITKYEPAKDQNLSFDVLKIGKTLEDLYPHLFRNLARQLGYVLRSDEELRTLFDRLGSNIIGSNPAEYRWGRILALLAISGSLSIDCIAQGHTELVENMVTIFCDFVEVHLLNWIIEHGGWASMAKLFSDTNEQDESTGAIVRNFKNSCVPMVCASAVCAGIAIVAGTLLEVL
ncbi:bcl-2-related ovarian killer protein-like [Styela clava]